MPRKGQTRKRTVPTDPVYSNTTVAKLVNRIILDGEKDIVQKVAYGAFECTREEMGKKPVEVFEAAMNNTIPVPEVRAKRISGATYQVPVKVEPGRRRAPALRWLMSFSRTRNEKTQEGRLAAELMDAANDTGFIIKGKEDVHKMAETNKVFAHYRF